MSTNPEIPPPDTIEPQAPPEMPVTEPVPERPYQEPPEIVPDTPNTDFPGQWRNEFPEFPTPTD